VTTITSEDYADVIFHMPDGRSILVTISKVGTYTLRERRNSQDLVRCTSSCPTVSIQTTLAWEAPVEGVIVK
jgi:hypothetical protein